MGIKVLLLALIVSVCYVLGAHSTIFTIRNNCPYTIWPATLTGLGVPISTGFELPSQASTNLDVRSSWSGRIWARFQCFNDGSRFTCRSGDCNTGQISCNGVGSTSPISLVQFTIAGPDNKDYYDISLVDGFNLPVSVSSERGGCPTTSCPVDINNQGCPDELVVRDPRGGVIGCKSACVAFNQPQYCCTCAFNSPATCKPTNYSQIFKRQCPQAYSYAYDDGTSTFTCPTGSNYHITFCP